jgi:hypothetical protein
VDQLTDWLPALTTTTLFGGAIWLARSLISTRLTNSVKNEFDSKIEVLRSELKSKEAQIESLRSGAMSGLITRQGALYQRKLEAIDQIWSAVKELDKAKHISSTMAILKFDVCAIESARNSKFRGFIETIGGNFEVATLNLSGAALARPFLTPLAWAYYSAFSSIILSAVTKMQILKIGVEEPEKYFSSEYSNKLLKTVLPSRSEYIEENDDSVHHYLLDEIEQLLLLELKNIQDGKEADKDNAKRAAEITREVENVTNEMAKMQTGA